MRCECADVTYGVQTELAKLATAFGLSKQEMRMKSDEFSTTW